MTTNTNARTNLTINREARELLITRTFDAPPELVFKAMTDPALLAQWWGPRKYATIIDRYELRPGGVWRFINRSADGEDFAFNGVFQEIKPPERLVYTFEYEGTPGHVILETTTLVARGSQTLMTVVDLFKSMEDLDGMIDAGMEEGMNESMEKLDELLEKMNQQG